MQNGYGGELLACRQRVDFTELPLRSSLEVSGTSIKMNDGSALPIGCIYIPRTRKRQTMLEDPI